MVVGSRVSTFTDFVEAHEPRLRESLMAAFGGEAGRDAANIGMEARINLADGDPEYWQSQANEWQGLGATHVSINTMRAGLNTPGDHINAIQQFKEVVG